MKRSLKILALVAAIAFGCGGCTKISLGGKKGGATGTSSGSLLDGPPELNGDWKITFVYNEVPHETTITFAQQGNQLAGTGVDDTGTQFKVENGTVDGKHIHFFKRYQDPAKQPVEYNGDMSYENDADYKGWTMLGHYKAMVGGQPVDDKWVGVNAAEAAAQEKPQENPDQTAENPDTNGGEPAAEGQPPPDINGMYTASYDYNFKKIDTRLWLKEKEGKVTGDGSDTNTNEYFVINQGWYNPEEGKLTIVCHYEKGKHAAQTRNLTIKASVGSNRALKGETQFGSPWRASFVR